LRGDNFRKDQRKPGSLFFLPLLLGLFVGPEDKRALVEQTREVSPTGKKAE
jgi:hypothetical protein